MTAAALHPLTLEALRAAIAREIADAPHLAAIREHNHVVLRTLDANLPLRGGAVLDLGGSSHGYALEAALDLGAVRYESANLDVGAIREVHGPDGATGRLHVMDAARLNFAEGTFDAAVSISTFEHFHRPGEVLTELHRVLRPGGVALISFEPVWTSARGHHLHHFGLADVLPPWAHLLLNETQLAEVLARRPWPASAPVSRVEVAHWICRGDGINRLSLRALRAEFENSLFDIEWLAPLRDDPEPAHAVIAAYLASLLPWRAEDLLTRGLSLLLRKLADPALAPTRWFFDEGFHPAELTDQGTVLRWAETQAVARLRAPAARRQRLALRLVTPFWEEAQQVEVTHGGRCVGTLEFSGSALADAPAHDLELDLSAGPNVLTFTARREARPLSPTDSRLAAFGLIVEA